MARHKRPHPSHSTSPTHNPSPRKRPRRRHRELAADPIATPTFTTPLVSTPARPVSRRPRVILTRSSAHQSSIAQVIPLEQHGLRQDLDDPVHVLNHTLRTPAITTLTKDNSQNLRKRTISINHMVPTTEHPMHSPQYAPIPPTPTPRRLPIPSTPTPGRTPIPPTPTPRRAPIPPTLTPGRTPIPPTPTPRRAPIPPTPTPGRTRIPHTPTPPPVQHRIPPTRTPHATRHSRVISTPTTERHAESPDPRLATATRNTFRTPHITSPIVARPSFDTPGLDALHICPTPNAPDTPSSMFATSARSAESPGLLSAQRALTIEPVASPPSDTRAARGGALRRLSFGAVASPVAIAGTAVPRPSREEEEEVALEKEDGDEERDWQSQLQPRLNDELLLLQAAPMPMASSPAMRSPSAAANLGMGMGNAQEKILSPPPMSQDPFEDPVSPGRGGGKMGAGCQKDVGMQGVREVRGKAPHVPTMSSEEEQKRMEGVRNNAAHGRRDEVDDGVDGTGGPTTGSEGAKGGREVEISYERLMEEAENEERARRSTCGRRRRGGCGRTTEMSRNATGSDGDLGARMRGEIVEDSDGSTNPPSPAHVEEEVEGQGEMRMTGRGRRSSVYCRTTPVQIPAGGLRSPDETG